MFYLLLVSCFNIFVLILLKSISMFYLFLVSINFVFDLLKSISTCCLLLVSIFLCWICWFDFVMCFKQAIWKPLVNAFATMCGLVVPIALAHAWCAFSWLLSASEEVGSALCRGRHRFALCYHARFVAAAATRTATAIHGKYGVRRRNIMCPRTSTNISCR